MVDRTVIALDDSHRHVAVATLAAAFQDDPALTWIIPDPAQRRRRLPLMFDWLFDDHLRHGLIIGTPGCEAVTFWRAPGAVHHHDRLWPPLLLRLLRIFGTCIRRGAAVGDAIAAHVPAGEHWHYLRYAGVRPDCQGQGLGGLVIRAGLSRAGHSPTGGPGSGTSAAATLETATPANVGIYLRLGFTVQEEWDVPGGGPRFWTMVHRHPSAASG